MITKENVKEKVYFPSGRCSITAYIRKDWRSQLSHHFKLEEDRHAYTVLLYEHLEKCYAENTLVDIGTVEAFDERTGYTASPDYVYIFGDNLRHFNIPLSAFTKLSSVDKQLLKDFK